MERHLAKLTSSRKSFASALPLFLNTLKNRKETGRSGAGFQIGRPISPSAKSPGRFPPARFPAGPRAALSSGVAVHPEPFIQPSPASGATCQPRKMHRFEEALDSASPRLRALKIRLGKTVPEGRGNSYRKTCADQATSLYSVPTALGCSQAVRHRFLVPACEGSNPSTPASFPENSVLNRSGLKPGSHNMECV